MTCPQRHGETNSKRDSLSPDDINLISVRLEEIVDTLDLLSFAVTCQALDPVAKRSAILLVKRALIDLNVSLSP